MKKHLLFLALFLSSFFLHSHAYSACEIPSDSSLRTLLREYVIACGAEGDSPLRYSPACSDFQRSTRFTAYERECNPYSPCGCLAAKDCYDDGLFITFSCHGSRPTPPPPPGPESRPSNCGDGIVQPERGEQCEPPYTGNCSETCQWIESKCGDGRVDIGRGEECEPPNTSHGNWECNESCKVKKVQPDPKCGDGTINQSWEECEPIGTTTCDANCRRVRFCGDGMVDVDLGEECERPNTLGCDRECKKVRATSTPPPAPPPPAPPAPFCGDGVVQPERGEVCEKAGVGNCRLDCTLIQASETSLVQQTLELLLEGGGAKCSMIVQSLQTNPLATFLMLFFSFGSLAGFCLIRRKK